MNLTYTERYLLKDISNKGFKSKYGVKSKKSTNKKTENWNKTKKERQEWWRNLTFDEQQAYIEKKQAQKAERRKIYPIKEAEYNPKYPWSTEGVNDTNREQWRAMIDKKNPWLNAA